MSPRKPGLALAALLACGLLPPAAASAQFYRYVDERGVVHLSDTPRDQRFVPVAVSSARGSFSLGPAPARADFDDLIARAALSHGVSPALVKAVVRAESNFDPNAVSHRGAQGLMQLMPQTAEALGVNDALRADENIWAGTRYLRAMIDRYGTWEHALAAYNAGPSAVDAYGGIPPYPETREYVNRVLKYYRRYHGQSVR